MKPSYSIQPKMLRQMKEIPGFAAWAFVGNVSKSEKENCHFAEI